MQLVFDTRAAGVKGKLFAVAVVALSLAGCGGGGGGGDDSGAAPVPEDAVALKDSVEIDESETVTVTTEGADELRAVDDKGSVSITKVGKGIFEVSAFDVDKPVSFILEALSGGGDVVDTAEVDIINTSGQKLVMKAERIVNDTEEVVDLPEDRRYVAYVLDLLYLRGDITNEQKKTRLTDYDDRSESWKTNTETWVSYVESSLEEYKNGELGEVALESATESFDSALSDGGDLNLTNIDDAIPDSADFAPDLESTTVEYSHQTGSFTRFHGDERFGRVSDDAFEFDDSYTWLREIAYGSGKLMCDVQSSSF